MSSPPQKEFSFCSRKFATLTTQYSTFILYSYSNSNNDVKYNFTDQFDHNLLWLTLASPMLVVQRWLWYIKMRTLVWIMFVHISSFAFFQVLYKWDHARRGCIAEGSNLLFFYFPSIMMELRVLSSKGRVSWIGLWADWCQVHNYTPTTIRSTTEGVCVTLPEVCSSYHTISNVCIVP